MPIEVRPLRETDDRSSFRSGHDELDRFFLRFAGQNQFRLHIGTTYVAVEQAAILGFATVASCSIEVAGITRRQAKRFPAYPIPALRLARMAVSRAHQRSGIGGLLMRAVFAIAREQAARSGCAFVVVDAKPGAITYYEALGFEPLAVEAGELEAKPTPLVMVLELGAIPGGG